MNKKKLTVGIVVGAVLLFVILFFANNTVGQSVEKKIVGQWDSVPVNGGCESGLENGIRINDNGTIEGIEGFKKYEIEETEQEYSHLIASGGYEDITRYKVSFTEDDLLVVLEEDVSDVLTCYFEKVE